MVRISGLKLLVDEDQSKLEKILLKKLNISKKDLLGYKIFKQSLDARKSSEIFFTYIVDADLRDEEIFLKKISNRSIKPTPDLQYHYVQTGSEKMEFRPLIVGSGPAGLFAGIILSEMGYRPVILERGSEVDIRVKTVKKFWDEGVLDPECNIQFGEGGAGTFSDGKLTTLINDKRHRKVLEEFVEAGAPAEILYYYKPHIGTDKLRSVVKNIREKIISLGGEVRFNRMVSDIILDGNEVAGVYVNGGERIDTSVILLAIGHSARDTFAMLHGRGVKMVQKPFSVGVRIEHPQDCIDLAQYKEKAGSPKLGPADYKLAYHASNGRSAYTFCMCPGGVVVAASSEEGCVVTNGMSEYSRSGTNANSALLVGVGPGDYGSSHPLAGVEFQRKWERKAFIAGGGNYKAPAQLLEDFMDGRFSINQGIVSPTYTRGVQFTDLNGCLPGYVIDTIKEAIPVFDQKLRGFALPDAVMTGVETRSSSPVRIIRNENFEASVGGLYPAGEGAGYAGGIVSAAVDGIRAAEAIASKYMPAKKV